MSTANRPWYREPMMWLVVALPASAVVAGLATLAIAAGAPADRAADAVRRVAQVQTADLAADRAASARGLAARLAVAAESGALRLELAGVAATPLTLRFAHPADADRDLEASLVPAGDGVWLGRAAPAPDVAWQLSLQPPAHDWRLAGRLHPGDRETRLVAAWARTP